MKKSFYIISTVILLYIAIIILAQISGVISSKLPISNSIPNLIFSSLLTIGFIGVLFKKQWAPVIISLTLLYSIPFILSNYNFSPTARIGSVVTNLVFISLCFLIYRSLKIHNNNKSMRKLFKIPLMILGVLYVLLIIFITIPGILNLFAKDILTINEAELQIESPNIPDSANAYYDLDQIKNVIYFPTSTESTKTLRDIVTATSGNVWSDVLINDVISKNQKTIEIVSDLSNKTLIKDSRFDDLSKASSETILPSYTSWRNAGLIASLNALNLLKQGKNIEAMDESIKVIKLGKIITDSNQPVIGNLVGMAIRGYGYSVASKIITSSHFDQVQKQNYLAELNSLRDDGQGLRNSFIYQYYTYKNSLKQIGDGLFDELGVPTIMKTTWGGFYYYKPNKTIEYLADYTREHIRNIDIYCEKTPDIKEVRFMEPLSFFSFFKFYFTENAVGKILHDVSVSSMSSVLTKRCEYNSKLDSIIKSLSESN